jgi:hypothetical protein
MKNQIKFYASVMDVSASVIKADSLTGSVQLPAASDSIAANVGVTFHIASLTQPSAVPKNGAVWGD